MVKDAELHLPYFKQGDDLRGFLQEKGATSASALRRHASMLRSAVETLEDLARVAEEVPEFEITDVDTHHIGVRGPKKLVDRLIEEGVLMASFEQQE